MFPNKWTHEYFKEYQQIRFFSVTTVFFSNG